MNGLANQLCPRAHPDRAEKGENNSAEKTEFLLGEKNPNEIFLTIHLITFVNQKAEQRKSSNQ